MSYFELPEEDRPPEHIWLDGEAIESHFKTVEINRKERLSGLSSVPQAGEEMENEHAAALLRRGR